MAKSPDAFRTISEVAAQLETPAHVLRFWESKFPQIKPVKRAGGRRYYRPDDIALVAGIKLLLHDQGMTIRGVQKLLRERGPKHVATLSALPWEGVDAAEEGLEAEEPMASDLAEAVEESEAEPLEEPVPLLDGVAADPVVVGPWPGAGGDPPAAVPTEAAQPQPTVVETFVAGVAKRLVAGRDRTVSSAQPSLARLRAALDGVEQGRLGADAARLRPLVERLRALRDGSPGRPG